MSRPRHRSRTIKSWFLRASTPALATLLTLSLAGGGALVALAAQNKLDDFVAQTFGCPNATELVVVADPTISSTVQTVANAFNAEHVGQCLSATITTQRSADTAALLASGTSTGADAWIPDSPIWLNRVESTATALGREIPKTQEWASVASSPLVLATPAVKVAEFEASEVGWGAILDGRYRTLLPDPESSSSSMIALATLNDLAADGDAEDFDRVLMNLGRSIPDSTKAAFTELQISDSRTVALATEREIVEHNASSPDEPLVALYPSEGTVALTYPFVVVENSTVSEVEASRLTEEEQTELAEIETARTKLLEEFADLVRGSSQVLNAEGFRDTAGEGEILASGVISAPVATKSVGDTDELVSILRNWNSLNLRSRILTVVDVSGSMLERAWDGQRRIEMFQNSAEDAFSTLSEDDELGMWLFSKERVGEEDWEDVAGIRSMNDPDHVESLQEIIDTLPSRINGYTGLNDTVLAAVTHVRDDFDPDKVNSVVLITDGRNEDDNGISLETLVDELNAMIDKNTDEPVPVVLVGIGPDTDVEAMRKIAQVTGGTAYQANNPTELSNVMLEALSQRDCRPNCS
ncbi:substrate-binding domain-containing protein [Salinibacterium sp. NK8237]|uniref:substrate-binding domain-containing protein n=1 Tax=Salinibacterium sp. NK8237 TaxID=2792038 RepID=UPI0018CC85FB|nr:substrate-binding domain-containing protein [Salinibacterium sp. NK8237]MBH0131231.1 substrate-binding domain-containing protein [Salinibacterium sp. NK8237]